MADYFQSQPNFTNPSYATPEQLATQRAYAAELQKRSGQDVNRPAGAAANVLDAITAALVRNNANTTQQQAAQGNARDTASLISQLQGGKVDPNTAAQIYANPMASPESRALITHLIQPEPVKSEYGQPGYQSPAAGVQASPIQGPYTPAYRVHQGAEGVSTDAPFPSPGAPAPGVSPTGPPVQPSPKVWGDQEAQAAGLYPPAVPVPAPRPAMAPQGGPMQPSQPAPAGPPGVPTGPLTLDALAAKGREFAAAKTLTQAGATAQGEGNQEDVRGATAAPAIIKGLGLIKSTIQASPGVTFGPTAGWSADVKRVIANYAPGLSDEKSLAGADAIEKLNFGLASQLAKTVGGTQGELFKAIGSTPGTEKSKQGTLALIDMMQQDQLKSQQLGAVYRQYEQAGRLQDYPAAREQFLTRHPTINPLSGKPIEMDIAAARKAAAANPPAGISGPPVGTTHNGYRFKGGNPNDKAMWEPVT